MATPTTAASRQDATRPARERARRRALKRLVTATVLAALVAAATTGIVGVASGAWQVRPILSGSMRPGFPVGGVVVTQRVPLDSLHVGDVVVFHIPHDPGATYVHRIVWLEHRGNELLVRTKGDANTVPDPWTLNVHGPVAYQARFTLPLIGYAAVWLHSPTGRNDMVAVAGLAFVVGALALALELVRERRARGAAGDPSDTLSSVS
ncbi:MAG: signal peptidase I [Actinomycetota bacterium]|jgi:signal peptidase I|nr:signal peptidase I [Actinomycetota bacterium]